MRAILVALAALTVTACAPTAPAPGDVADRPVAEAPRAEPPTQRPPLPSEPDTCNRAQFADLVGRPLSSVERSRLPAGARVVCHNCPMTMDHSPSRLNVMLDQQERVSEVRCG